MIFKKKLVSKCQIGLLRSNNSTFMFQARGWAMKGSTLYMLKDTRFA